MQQLSLSRNVRHACCTALNLSNRICIWLHVLPARQHPRWCSMQTDGGCCHSRHRRKPRVLEIQCASSHRRPNCFTSGCSTGTAPSRGWNAHFNIIINNEPGDKTKQAHHGQGRWETIPDCVDRCIGGSVPREVIPSPGACSPEATTHQRHCCC